MVRKAMIEDVPAIYTLLRYYGDNGEMVARPLSQLYDHLRDFWVYENPDDNNKIIGCCALQFCWESLAEIRSLAVKEGHTSIGTGTLLVDRCIQEALVFNVSELFVLTYRPSFFEKFDFKTVDKSKLPKKVWSDCMFCVKFPDCDETAMIKKIKKIKKLYE